MLNKYYNDGIIGNDTIKATFNRKSELIRLYYGSPDFKQFIKTFQTALKINNDKVINMQYDVYNTISQKYVEKTNVLDTQIYNSTSKISVNEIDCVPIEENFLLKQYTIRNENKQDTEVELLIYSKLLSNENNHIASIIKNDTLIQYSHDFSFSLFSNEPIYKSQLKEAYKSFKSGNINGNEYSSMEDEVALSYNLGTIEVGKEKTINIIICINPTSKFHVGNELEEEIDRIKNTNMDFLEIKTEDYWKKFVTEHDKLNVIDMKIDENIKEIYNRTILLYDLLINKKTGGISAGFEVDEEAKKCGRYSYCWLRDAAFVTPAMDVLGMEEQVEKFYSNFCKMTQNQNGSWEQRYYTDGNLAPCWGYQVDEIANVINGVFNHFSITQDIKFVENNMEMLEKAIDFLYTYIDDINSKERKLPKSFDIWEEYEGESLYSISCVYSAFVVMREIYITLINPKAKRPIINDKIEKLERYANITLTYVMDNFYNEKEKYFSRNLTDSKADISFIGTIVPNRMLGANYANTKKTIEKINLVLKTYSGGYLRYENDKYMGGTSPWIISSLWMAMYYLDLGNIDKALENFNFATQSASVGGLLAEQVDNITLKPSWVLGLAWSHAMYIIVLDKLIKMKVNLSTPKKKKQQTSGTNLFK